MVQQLQERLKHQKIQLHLSEGVYAFLAQQGYQPEFGARPIQEALCAFERLWLLHIRVIRKTTEMTNRRLKDRATGV